MPVKTPPASLKAKSPSKAIQRGVDTAWGAHQGTESPQKALAKKYNDCPVKVSGAETKG